MVAGGASLGPVAGAQLEWGLGWVDVTAGLPNGKGLGILAGGVHAIPFQRAGAFGSALRVRCGADVFSMYDDVALIDVGVGLTVNFALYLDVWVGYGVGTAGASSRYRFAFGYGARGPESQFNIYAVTGGAANYDILGVGIAYGRKLKTGPNWERTRADLLEPG